MNSDNVKMHAAIGLFILSAIVITMLMVLYMTGGVRLGSEYEVLEGVKDGEKVVVEGQLRIKDGAQVEVKQK